MAFGAVAFVPVSIFQLLGVALLISLLLDLLLRLSIKGVTAPVILFLMLSLEKNWFWF